MKENSDEIPRGPIGAFRTPTLRNVAMTPPYMHTRSIAVLDDVAWYYHGVDVVDVHAVNGGELDEDVPAWDFTEEEVADLVAFLATLTTTECEWNGGMCPPVPSSLPPSWPSG